MTRAVEELLDDNNADTQAYNQHNNAIMKPLVQQVLSAPASSASSERVFSQAGLIMKLTRSRLSKELLSILVFLKCNSNQF